MSGSKSCNALISSELGVRGQSVSIILQASINIHLSSGRWQAPFTAARFAARLIYVNVVHQYICMSRLQERVLFYTWKLHLLESASLVPSSLPRVLLFSELRS